MVDPLHSANSAETPALGTAKKSKRNKKKKNKSAETSVNETSNNPKIVTLRNPLFQSNSNDPMRNITSQPQGVPININQSASIIKNENGMFTIRNTALHQALQNGVGHNFRQYGNEIYTAPEPTHSQQMHGHSQPQQPHATDAFSYFSHGMSGDNGAHKKPNVGTIGQAAQPCTMAIGSEIKNAQQMKNMPWSGTLISKATTASTNGDLFNKMSHLNPQPTRSYSPFDPMPNYGFNSDFIGSSPTPHAQPSTGFYNNGGGYGGSNNYNHSDNSSLFCGTSSGDSHRSHRCDDSPPLHDMNQYYNGLNQSSYYDKYDNISNLQPGHRLNSEVQI